MDAIHPLGEVSAIRHGDIVQCESTVIATYIDKTLRGPKLIIVADRLASSQTATFNRITFCS